MKIKQLICPGIRQISVGEIELPPVPDDGILVQNQVTAVSIATELWGWMQGGNPGQESIFPEQQATVVRGL